MIPYSSSVEVAVNVRLLVLALVTASNGLLAYQMPLVVTVDAGQLVTLPLTNIVFVNVALAIAVPSISVRLTVPVATPLAPAGPVRMIR
jgi:hypothetical protein